MLAERLRDSLPNEIKFYVEATRPATSEEVPKYADLHFECMLSPSLQLRRLA